MSVTSKPQRKPLVLCVDDESAVLASVARALRHEPYDVLTTMRPSDVLQLMDRQYVDLLVTDQRMAEMSGTELLAVVRRRSPDTLCVVLTGYSETALVVERAHLRIQRLITKPWDNQDLMKTIRELLARRLPAGAFAPKAPEEPAPPERIDCTGLTSTQVMDRVAAVIGKTASSNRPIGLALDKLPMVSDSLARVFKELTRLVSRNNVKVTLYDSSGYASWFLSTMKSPVQVKPLEEKRSG